MDLEGYRDIIPPDALSQAEKLLTLPRVTAQINGDPAFELIGPGTKLTSLDPNFYQPRSDTKPTVVTRAPELIEQLKRRLGPWHERRAKRTKGEHDVSTRFGAAFSGIPGMGKSTTARRILTEVERQLGTDTPLSVFDFDSTFRTPRDSPLREATNLPPEIFHRLRYHCRDSIGKILPVVLGTDEAVTIESSELYDRPTGKVKPGVLSFSEEEGIVALDGAIAVEVATQLREMSGMGNLVTIGLHDAPSAVMKRLIARDVQRGARTSGHASTFRAGEFNHLVPYAERTLLMADVVWAAPSRYQQYSFSEWAN